MTGSAGLLLASVQNTIAKENLGAIGVFSRFGGTIALFAAMGGTYQFITTATANLREKQDPWNQFLGGFSAGSFIGLRSMYTPVKPKARAEVLAVAKSSHETELKFRASPTT